MKGTVLSEECTAFIYAVEEYTKQAITASLAYSLIGTCLEVYISELAFSQMKQNKYTQWNQMINENLMLFLQLTTSITPGTNAR
jgi:hypothetical protein